MWFLTLIAGLLEKLGISLWEEHEQSEHDPEALERKEAADMARPHGPWDDVVRKL